MGDFGDLAARMHEHRARTAVFPDVDPATRDQLFARGKELFEGCVADWNDDGTPWEDGAAWVRVMWACAAAAERGIIAPLN
ncbi:MAG: hypothetical protein WAV90_02485 [Gordonia amarae]